MGRQRRRKENGTYLQSRGQEFYRGHVIEKCVVRLAGVPFWRVDVFPIGLTGAEPQVFLQAPTEKASLERLVSEAKGLIGHIIHQGTGVDAVQVKEGYMADRPKFDSLIMKSATGKRAVCPRHWALVESGARAGNVNALVLGIELMRRFTARLYSDGMLTQPNAITNSYTVNMLLDSYAPLCCWLGDAEFANLLSDANPTMLLERAREKGVL